MQKYNNYVNWRESTSVGNNIIGLTEIIKNITAVKIISSVTWFDSIHSIAANSNVNSISWVT